MLLISANGLADEPSGGQTWGLLLYQSVWNVVFDLWTKRCFICISVSVKSMNIHLVRLRHYVTSSTYVRVLSLLVERNREYTIFCDEMQRRRERDSWRFERQLILWIWKWNVPKKRWEPLTRQAAGCLLFRLSETRAEAPVRFSEYGDSCSHCHSVTERQLFYISISNGGRIMSLWPGTT